MAAVRPVYVEWTPCSAQPNNYTLVFCMTYTLTGVKRRYRKGRW